ncbi:NPC intracellular cholesterol transporter 1 homolog 1b-like [Cydia amplana]|uniref:NPC intracellular cholesterol transporter 1 homolog 1b-like n=1 Tax=Cydia amplana TaxID=1869771 RepID=UPI002FE68BAC
MKLLSIFIIFLWLRTSVKGDCVMREECGAFGGFDKTCYYNGPALPVLDGLTPEERSTTLETIERRCPFLLYDENDNRLPDDQVLTCCDSAQIAGMARSLLMADGVLGRCPTCMRNFQRQICEMNCSPDQARFVEVNTTTESDVTYVSEVHYRVYNDFMIDAHSSCAGVIVPQTGMPAINMMCGDAPVCDADAFFGFTGDTSANPLAPVQVNFLRWPTPEDSMNARAPPCNETSFDDFPCSCVDCFNVCPSGNEPYVPEMCTVASLNCAAFSIGLIVCIITVGIFTFLTVREAKKYRQSTSQERSKPLQPKKPKLNMMQLMFQKIFSKIGAFSANNAVLTIMLTSWLAFAALFGVFQLNLTANPLELWSSPDSTSRADFNYFNSRFGPFYRTAQVYMQIKGLDSFEFNNVTYGPAFRLEAIEELVRLEDAILNIGRDNDKVTLEKVCFAPLRQHGGAQLLDQCTLMSVSVYLGSNRNNINNQTYLSQITGCVNNFYGLDCLASWGGGSEPEITFGGFDGDDIFSADTLLINIPIANHLLQADLEPALEWENQFLELMHEYAANGKPDFVDVTYAAERSIEDEIERVSVAETIPIAISYVLMFLYVTISLGNIRYCKTWFVDSKIMVAVGSITVEIIAILCAMGTMGYAGITLTLLAINVIPFFVLSVGIDNVFLMVNTIHSIEGNLKSYDDYNPDMNLDQKRIYVFSKMMGKVGPSMFVASVTQVTCFGIGALANFPAVVTFSVFACISLGFLFVFQITTVVAILSLDYKRASQNRFDIFCCIQKKILDDENPLTSDTPRVSLTQKLMEPYAKILLNWKVKIFVVIIFIGMLVASIFLIPRIEIGLDQEMALPQDSYVYKYLQSVSELLRLGPPVYFILKSGLNFTNTEHQNLICGGQLCNDDSLIVQIFLAAQHEDITYISRSSNSWLDDYFDWSSLQGACCKYNVTDGGFCQSSDMSPECLNCVIERDEATGGLRMSAEAFNHYLPFFLQDTPTETCSKGGLASYFNGVNYILDSEGRASVHDSHFMAYHSPLSTSHDYITAVRYGYEVSHNITAMIKERTHLDVEVVPYSLFYVYYHQYLTMWRDTFSSIGYCLIGAMVFNLIASGFNVLTTFAVLCTTIMVVVNMMGVMYIWSIPLNAVSTVNLIVAIGIAVEFCSHLAYAYATSSVPREERVEDALKAVGATIITGITFTNIPVIVLAFSYTEIIEVFFFRMFFSLVVLGFLHGMIFFPVFLSYLTNIKSK